MTDISNLALVCARHHTAVHQGIWTITMRDGVPWVIPPDWVDEQRRPLRNTYRADTATMHRLGTQMRLDLNLPTGTGTGTGTGGLAPPGDEPPGNDAGQGAEEQHPNGADPPSSEAA